MLKLRSPAALASVMRLVVLFASPVPATTAPPLGRLVQLLSADVWQRPSKGVASVVRGAGHRSRLLRIADRMRLSLGVGGTAVRGRRRLSAQRVAAAHPKENLNALRAREIFAQFREGTPSPA